jgi:hypothetical protein
VERLFLAAGAIRATTNCRQQALQDTKSKEEACDGSAVLSRQVSWSKERLLSSVMVAKCRTDQTIPRNLLARSDRKSRKIIHKS